MRTRVARIAKKASNHRAAIVDRMHSDDGLSTAEYAVGTVAAAGLGGILIKILTSDEVRNLIWNVVSTAFKSLLG